MAHLTSRGAYESLVERLNRFPQGAPPSELLFAILALLFTEREAALVARLPLRPFTARSAAERWQVPEQEARAVLDALASRAILLDLQPDGEPVYMLPPPMAGFFEFSMMRLRGDVDQRLLGELFYQYINVEDDFITALFLEGRTQLGRVFVDERAVPASLSLQILDHERASEVARRASCIGVGLCYCRHKMQHAGRACGAPLDICLTFNSTASSLVRHGAARRIDSAECLDLLDRARSLHLVQFGENVRERVNFICNCCGCCCEALVAARRFGFLHPVHSSGYLPAADRQRCNGCGKCVDACPVEAMALVSANDPARPRQKTVRLAPSLCLGCGVCAGACPRQALRLEAGPARVITPLDSTHRTVLMAIERGTLQHLIFDDPTRVSHRALAAVLGVILRLPPVRRALASRQLGSHYLEALIRRHA